MEWRRLGRLVAVVAGASATFVVVGPAFLVHVLGQHVGALYASYEVPPLDGLAF
ncbi:MAG: hypothetical protein ABIR79_07130 [Candidatus Binatia bacterium]